MAGDLGTPSPTPINHPRKDDLPRRIQRHHICISQNWEYGDPRLDVDQATTTQINDVIAYSIWFYEESDYDAKTLWLYFKQDFSQWNEQAFQKGNASLVRDLRDFLREKGVYCTIDGGRVTASLTRVIRESTQTPWPLDNKKLVDDHDTLHHDDPRSSQNPQQSSYHTPPPITRSRDLPPVQCAEAIRKATSEARKLLATDGETCTVEMPRAPTKSQATVTKPFHRDRKDLNQKGQQSEKPDKPQRGQMSEEPEEALDEVIVNLNPKRGQGRPRKPRLIDQAFNEHDWQLCLQLRQEDKLTTPGRPFELSGRKEINALRARDVFSQLVREIKGKDTNTPYEKSRLVIQGYSDHG